MPEQKGPTIGVMQFIWAALLVMQVLQVVFRVCYTQGGFVEPGRMLNLTVLGDFSNPTRIIMSLQALLVLAVAVFLPRFLLKATKKRREGNPPVELIEMTRLYYVPLIMRLALLQAVTLLGVVVAIAQKEPAQVVPFFLVGMLGTLMSFPSEARVRAAFDGAIRPE